MGYIKALEDYSVDKELVFKAYTVPNLELRHAICDLPSVENVNKSIVVFIDHLQRITVNVNIYTDDNVTVCVRLIELSKAKPANLYKQILKQLESKKAEIDESIVRLQENYNYRQEAIEDAKHFDNIPVIKRKLQKS